ncbi:hypothetical protein GCM10027168_67570 [Streptomyces capparidis]
MSTDSDVGRESGGEASRHPAAPHPKQIGPAILGGVVVLSLFLWIIAAALHNPKPNDLPLGVVGDAATVQQVEQQLERAPGSLDITAYQDVETAKEALEDQEVLGVFAPGPDSSELFVTGATGLMPKNFFTNTFTSMAMQSGQTLTVTDLAPLPEGDSTGFIALFLFASMTIATVAFLVVLTLRAPRLPVKFWLGPAAVYSVLAGLTAIAIVRWTFDAYPSDYWALSGLCALYAFAILACVKAFQLVGFPGIGLGALTFLVFGIASSGGGVNRYFMPDFYVFINEYMPGGAFVTGLRSIGYLDGAALGTPMAVILGWLAVGLVVAIGGHAVKERRQAALPSGAGEGAATPSRV